MRYETGPFRYLNNQWDFLPHDNGTEVAFFVDFEFRSRILQAAIGVVFNEAVRRMVERLPEAGARRVWAADRAPDLQRGGAGAGRKAGVIGPGRRQRRAAAGGPDPASLRRLACAQGCAFIFRYCPVKPLSMQVSPEPLQSCITKPRNCTLRL